ncbi:MAG: diaminopimelate epimerase [Fusobacteriaceae bacterium]|jgi:diaminopimelate epimerase|nr:diaminopimelate epimerase [Fusobacteriaceae bacterium]
MKFWKMHGAGNDFVVFDGFAESSDDWGKTALLLCDRHFGVGADGIEFCTKSEVADIRYNYYNADGSRGEMCGNGIRCFSKYVYEKGIVTKERFTAETDAGIKEIVLSLDAEKKVRAVSVGMGKGNFDPAAIPCKLGKEETLNEELVIEGKKIVFSSVLMGVPHTVIFTDDPDDWDLEGIGPLIERHEAFPRKTNVNFVQIIDDATIRVKTWERGAGHTLACGTGSCAVAILARKLGKIKGDKVRLILEGGEVEVALGKDYEVTLTGPAAKVFEGEIDLGGGKV